MPLKSNIPPKVEIEQPKETGKNVGKTVDKEKYVPVASRSRHTAIKKKYKITMRDTNRLMREQNGGCAICEIQFTANKKWYVDHDHITDAVRGLLCCGCNTGLGKLGDSIVGLKRALKYLTDHAKKL